MPLYAYRCAKCEHEFEALVFNGDTVECPECQSAKVDPLLNVPAAPRTQASSLPMNCGEGPPCGAPWCQRKG
jgi:putative FmdB family regulatory protein